MPNTSFSPFNDLGQLRAGELRRALDLLAQRETVVLPGAGLQSSAGVVQVPQAQAAAAPAASYAVGYAASEPGNPGSRPILPYDADTYLVPDYSRIDAGGYWTPGLTAVMAGAPANSCLSFPAAGVYLIEAYVPLPSLPVAATASAFVRLGISGFSGGVIFRATQVLAAAGDAYLRISAVRVVPAPSGGIYTQAALAARVKRSDGQPFTLANTFAADQIYPYLSATLLGPSP